MIRILIKRYYETTQLATTSSLRVTISVIVYDNVNIWQLTGVQFQRIQVTNVPSVQQWIQKVFKR